MESDASSAREVKVPAATLKQHLCECLLAAGLPGADAEIVADSLTEADLRGVHSHGALRIPYYVERIAKGGVKAKPHIRIEREGPAFALIDGDDGMGQVVAERAMQVAIEKARGAGVGWVLCRRSSHFGAAAYWAMSALGADMIGMAATNTIPSMFAWGGATPLVGNNPICYAVPAGRHPPVVLDMAMSVVAHGKVAVLHSQGRPIPEGWLLDRDGRPTTDPMAVSKGGAVAPIGGYKGFGMALIMDILCGVLSGANFAGRLPARATGTHFGAATETPFGNGHTFMAIDIGSFMAYSDFSARMEELVDTVLASRLAAGFDRIYLPGQIEHETRLRRLEMGVPCPRATVRGLNDAAAALGLTTRIGQ